MRRTDASKGKALYNAMRSSKRVLAGIAAGALGVGVLSVVAAPSASAVDVVPASFKVYTPSYTVVGTNLFSDFLNAEVAMYDAAGDQISTADTTVFTGRELRVSVTPPANDASNYKVGPKTTAGSSYTGAVINVNDSAEANSLDVSLDTGTYADFDALVGAGKAGTWTMNVALVNTNSGATIQSATIPVQIVTAAGAPTASITYLTATSQVINALGVDDTQPVADQGFLMTNASGGRYVANLNNAVDSPVNPDETITATMKVGSGSTYDWDPVQAYGGNEAGLEGFPGLYVGDIVGSPVWRSSGQKQTIVTAAGYTNGSTSSALASANLPVYVGSEDQSSVEAELTTSPSFTADGINYEVKPGTQAFSWDVTGDADMRAVWNATSNASGGVAVASGGTSLLEGGQGTVSFNVSAPAAAVGKVLTVAIGDVDYTVTFTNPAPYVDANQTIAKVSSAATMAGTITDQYGEALSGTWQISLQPASGVCFTSATQLAAATADAEGAFSLTVPASAAPATAQDVTYTLCASNGLADTSNSATVVYTATGEVSSLALDVVDLANIPVVNTPKTGYVALADTTSSSVTNVANANVNLDAVQPVFFVTATSTPAVTVTLSVSEGAYLTSRTSGTIAWSAGKSSLLYGADGETQIGVYATKPGVHTITATSGTVTDTQQFVAGVKADSGWRIEALQDKIEVAPLSSNLIKAKVTDIYGNAVPLASVGLQGLGSVFQDEYAITTAADGVAQAFFLAGDIEGPGIARFDINNPVSGTVAVPPGSPVRKVEADTEVMVGKDKSKTILIVGERTTVSGKPGIMVDGDTTGFAAGDTVKPWVRFPGQSSYTAGSARPAIKASGEFTWQRKTGKKTYVYFTSADDVTKSNRVIIPAN